MKLRASVAALVRQLSGQRRDALWLGGGTVIGQLFILAATPALARIFDPGAFGAFGVIQAFVLFSGVAVLLRLDMAILACDTDAEAFALLRLCLKISTAGALVATIVFVALVDFEVGPFAVLPVWSAGLVFLILLFVSAISACRYYLIRGRHFNIIGINSAIQGGVRACGGVLLGVISPGWWSLVLSELAARLIGAGWLLIKCQGNEVHSYAWHSLLRRSKRYPLVVFPSSVIDALGHALTQPLLVALFGIAEGGLYLLAAQIAIVPAALFSAAFSDVIHGQAARLRHTDTAAWRTLFQSYFVTLSAFAIIAYVPLGIVMAFFGERILGADWKLIEVLVPLLCLSSSFFTVSSPLSRIIIARNRPEIKLVSDILVLMIPNITVGAAYGLAMSFTEAVIALVLSQAACAAIFLSLSWRVANERAGGISVS